MFHRVVILEMVIFNADTYDFSLRFDDQFINIFFIIELRLIQYSHHLQFLAVKETMLFLMLKIINSS
jgi:hypothetical protein